MRSLFGESKRGQFQLASGAVMGVIGFLLAVIVGLIIVGTLVNGGFFASTSDSQGALNNISSNVTSGINTVVGKFPTVFTVIGVAIVLAIIALLVLIVRKMGVGGGNFSQ